MAGRTARWGFNLFDSETEGSLGDDGGKFTGSDRAVLDRLLAALEAHDHGGGARLADPSAAPSLALDTAGGSLEGGVTYHYVVTYIDQYGLETAASDEVSVTTPSQVAIPQNPGVSTVAGGALEQGLHQYAVTAHNGAGETPLSGISSITVRDQLSVEVSFVVPTDADAISVWRQGPTDEGFTRLATVGVGASPFLDDGSIPAEDCPCDPENLPPDENTTASESRVTVTAPVGDLVIPTDAERWRIYRSETSGVYGPTSLLADIADTTVDGGSQLVETYLDDGTVALTAGQPPLTSQTLLPSQELAGGGGGAGGGMLLLRASDGSVWQLTATDEGQIETLSRTLGAGASVASFADLGLSLVDSDDVSWRVTVGTDGILETAQVVPVAGEASFIYGNGPDLPTSDARRFFRLGVAPDGDLVTYG